MEVNLGYLLRRNAFKFSDREAIIFEDRRINYGAFNSRTNQRANALLAMGVKKGDHVATLFLNCNEVLETFFALLKIGAVLVPLNVRLSGPELTYIIDHSDATTMVLSEGFRTVVEGIRPNLEKLERFLYVGRGCPDNMIDFDDLAFKASADEPKDNVQEEDVAYILYTAGTTGRPKGVVMTHRNSVWAAVNSACDVGSQPGKVLLVFPLYHVAACTLVNTNIFVGRTNVLLKAFDPRVVMEIVDKEGINRMSFPPTVWNFILQVPDLDRYRRDSVHFIQSGAEVMPQETKRRLMEVFPNAKLGESYGMTESAATITTCKPEDVHTKFASVGKPFTNVEIRLVDEHDRDVPQGAVGEILFRGPTMMREYYKDPEATEEALRAGWMHTGDLGRLDEEGFLYIVDRKKDMIITGGENVYPREIEEVLYTHPKILEAAVIGLPDPTWGEKIHAVVALKDGETMTEEEVIAYTKGRIASFKKPKSVSFVDRLPRNPAGKVLKTVLRDDHI